MQERGNLLWETLLVIGERRLLPWHFHLQKIKSLKILPIVTLRECYLQRPENPVNFLKTMLIESLGTSPAPFSLSSHVVKRSEIAPAEREKWETWVGSGRVWRGVWVLSSLRDPIRPKSLSFFHSSATIAPFAIVLCVVNWAPGTGY